MVRGKGMAIKAVIFDMDGVLFDTEKLCMDSWMVVAEEWGIPDMEAFSPPVSAGISRIPESCSPGFTGMPTITRISVSRHPPGSTAK